VIVQQANLKMNYEDHPFFFGCGGNHRNIGASSFGQAVCVKVISIRKQMIYEDEQYSVGL